MKIFKREYLYDLVCDTFVLIMLVCFCSLVIEITYKLLSFISRM